MSLKSLLDSPRVAYSLAGVAILLLVVVLLWPTPRANDPLADKLRVSAAVSEAIRTNPEMIVEALQAMQSRQAQMQQQMSQQAVLANRMAIERDGESHVGGNRDGDVTIVEFFDYRCPYCKQAQASVNELLKSDQNIRFVYKEFPILGPESMIASRAAVAARNSAYYVAFHDALMTAPSPLTEEAVLKIAGNVGINVSALQVEMRRPEIEQIIAANHDLAQRLGINGTPAFIIGGTLVPGVMELDEMKQAVADMRAMSGRR